jgi:hypothetical protein
MNTRRLAFVPVLLLIFALSAFANAEPVAQAPTATPQPVNLSTRAPGGVPDAAATATRTPTPEGQIFLEAREFANVRAQPDTDAAQLGQIFSGEQYVAVARYFQWIQFVYEPSPTGRAWVFADLVDVTGDVAQLPELTDPGELSPNDDEINAIGTQAAVTLTPGGLLTATADSRFQALGQATLAGPLILPTFTYPPGIVMIPTSAEPLPDSTPAPTPAASTADGALPPIVPVLLIGGLGVIGLLINGLRRRG